MITKAALELGTRHEVTLLAKHQLAIVAEKEGFFSSAAKMYSIVVTGLAATRGPKHRETLNVKVDHANVLKQMKNYDLAEKIYASIISACASQSGNSFQILEAEAKANYALMLVEKADSLESTADSMARSAIYLRASDLGESVWGSDDEDVIEWRKISQILEKDFRNKDRKIAFDETGLSLEPGEPGYKTPALKSMAQSLRSSRAAGTPKAGTPRRATNLTIAADEDDLEIKREFFSEFGDDQSEQGSGGKHEDVLRKSERVSTEEETVVQIEEMALEETPVNREGAFQGEISAPSRSAHSRMPPSKDRGDEQAREKSSKERTKPKIQNSSARKPSNTPRQIASRIGGGRKPADEAPEEGGNRDQRWTWRSGESRQASFERERGRFE